MNVGVVGLGKLGLPIAVAFASRGFDVTGVDIDADVVGRANANAPHPEPDVNVMLGESLETGRFHATTDFEALAETQASFVIVPTPSMDDGWFFAGHAVVAVRRIGHVIANSPRFHLVVLVSTVMPGTCGADIIPALESAAHRQIGAHLGFCYHPEFVALGSVVQDFLYPRVVLIGEATSRSGVFLETLFRVLYDGFPAAFHRMSLVSAELAKLSLNYALTMRIDFANATATLCERFGASASAVLDAISADPRIGHACLRAGASFGGPCFPRDVRAMAALDARSGAQGILQRNDHVVDRIARRILDTTEGSVGILGIAYKCGTPVTEASFGSRLQAVLREHGRDVLTCDPMAPGNYGSADGLVEIADTVVVALPYPEFGLLSYRPGQTVIDMWRLLDLHALPDGVTLIQWGEGA